MLADYSMITSLTIQQQLERVSVGALALSHIGGNRQLWNDTACNGHLERYGGW